MLVCIQLLDLNTTIGYWNPNTNQLEQIYHPYDGLGQIPTFSYYNHEEKEILFGSVAKEHFIRHPNQTIFGYISLLGRTDSLLNSHPSFENGKFKMDESFEIGTEVVIKDFLKHLVDECILPALNRTDLEYCLIVPDGFNTKQKELLFGITKELQLNVLNILEVTQAAILSFNASEKLSSLIPFWEMPEEEPKVVLSLSMGYYTSTVSLIEKQPHQPPLLLQQQSFEGLCSVLQQWTQFLSQQFQLKLPKSLMGEYPPFKSFYKEKHLRKFFMEALRIMKELKQERIRIEMEGVWEGLDWRTELNSTRLENYFPLSQLKSVLMTFETEKVTHIQLVGEYNGFNSVKDLLSQLTSKPLLQQQNDLVMFGALWDAQVLQQYVLPKIQQSPFDWRLSTLQSKKCPTTPLDIYIATSADGQDSTPTLIIPKGHLLPLQIHQKLHYPSPVPSQIYILIKAEELMMAKIGIDCGQGWKEEEENWEGEIEVEVSIRIDIKGKMTVCGLERRSGMTFETPIN